MKKTFFLLPVIVVLFSCNEKHGESNYTTLDSTSENNYGPSAVPPLIDSVKQFIRSADVKYRVKEVVAASNSIEQSVLQLGGYITRTTLSSTLVSTTSTLVKADSSLQVKKYTRSNFITIRVPNGQLDTLLRKICVHSTYLEHRTIKADDISLELLSNEWVAKRAVTHGQRVSTAIRRHGKKLSEVVNAEETLYSGQEANDNVKLTTLSLQDKVKYSTIELEMYQEEVLLEEMVYTPQTTIPYEPPLLAKLAEAIKGGWRILEYILVFLVKMWGIILLVIGLVFLLKKRTLLMRSIKL